MVTFGEDPARMKKVYAVHDIARDLAQRFDENMGTYQPSEAEMQQTYLLPSVGVRSMMAEAVTAAKAPSAKDPVGDMHEEGGVWGNTREGVQKAVAAESGPLCDAQECEVDPYWPKDQGEYDSLESIEGSYHVHVKGAAKGNTQTGRFVIGSEGPSTPDQEAVGGHKQLGRHTGSFSIVLDTKTDKVYLYDEDGTKATFRSIEKFTTVTADPTKP